LAEIAQGGGIAAVAHHVKAGRLQPPRIMEDERAGRPANDVISDVERQRREDAVDFARASVGLEGFTPSEEAEAHARQYINGEIELAEFVKGPS
jgi:hypothetical protein